MMKCFLLFFCVLLFIGCKNPVSSVDNQNVVVRYGEKVGSLVFNVDIRGDTTHYFISGGDKFVLFDLSYNHGYRDTVALSWEWNLSLAKEISSDDLLSFEDKGPVFIKPETFLLRITTGPYYQWESNELGVITRIEDSRAEQKYGKDWENKVVICPDSFLVWYQSK